MEIGDEVPDDPGRLYLPIPLLLVFLALPVAIELVLLASDAGWISTPRLRQTLYQYGAFWAGLLDNWRPNYAAQPWLMFLTYSFLHSGFWHLAGNMLMLVILLQLNSDWLRGWTFVAVYVLSAFGGAIGFALLGSVLNPMVGASGALFGLVGAGRTEMMKIAAGVLKRDFFHGGEVRFNGELVRYRVPAPAVRDGIVYVTEERKQEGFFETMSIAENIYMASLAGKAGGSLKIVSMTAAREAAETWRQKLNIRTIDANAKVIELSGGNQQKVVIAKALIQKPKLVIFDEPTRGVDGGAIVEIHNFIKSLADQGIGVVVISSYLPEVLAISDRVLIARQGKIVEEMDARTATEKTIMYAAVH